MPDYTRSTGSSGTMMIRDTGLVVEFWLRAGADTFNYQLDWSFVINGVNGTREFRFEQGGAWQRLASFETRTGQTVHFGIGRSGTVGLGGPTTLSANISRSSVPDAPIITGTFRESDTAIRFTWVDGASNGSPILQRDAGIRRLGPENFPDAILANAPNNVTFSGLITGQEYEFWVAARNAEGWGPRAYSKLFTAVVPGEPTNLWFNDVTQNSVGVHITPPFDDGGRPILDYQIGYGLQETAPSRLTVSGRDSTLPNLTPGRIYYVKVRARNQYGYGNFGPTLRVILVGGAFVKVNGVQAPAVPYVNVGGVNGTGGVWKLARPYAKKLGEWKISI